MGALDTMDFHYPSQITKKRDWKRQAAKVACSVIDTTCCVMDAILEIPAVGMQIAQGEMPFIRAGSCLARSYEGFPSRFNTDIEKTRSTRLSHSSIPKLPSIRM